MESSEIDKVEEHLEQLQDVIINHPHLIIKNIIKDQVESLIAETTTVKQFSRKKIDAATTKCRNLATRKSDLLTRNDVKQRDISRLNEEIDGKRIELQTKRNDFDSMQQALEAVLNRYTEISQTSLNINKTADELIVTVILVPAVPNCGVKLKIDPKTHRIIDIDVKSILTPPQENKLFETVYKSDIISIFTILRRFILKKSSNL